jgi:amino acid transporter
MNIWSVTALGIGAMVGAGIFALLGVVALDAGDETYIAFLLGGIIAMLSGYSYAKLSARYPDSGGIVEFFEQAFGVGRLAGSLSLIFLITVAGTIAMVAKAFGAYAAPLAFGTTNALWVDIFASGITLVIVLLNVAGSRLVGKAEVVLVGIKLTILTLLIGAGAYGLMTHAAVKHVTPHFSSVIGSVGVTLLAFAGYGMMPNAAGSVAHPRKTIPRAIYLAIGIVTLIYVVLALVVVGTVPIASLAQDADTAVAEAARPVLGQIGYVIVSVTALLATASCINAWMFTEMQLSMAMAEASQLPRIFKQLVWRKGTFGLLLGVGGILLAINVLDLTALASIASTTFMLSHMAVQVAHWRLIDQTKGSRAVVAATFLAMTAVLLCFLWTIASNQPWTIALIAAFIGGSFVVEMCLVSPKVAIRPER